MREKTFTCQGLVLMRVNVGESDRIIHFLTQERGNFSAVAKGVRRLKSVNRALLEPGNLVKAFFVQTKSLPLLTQAQLIRSSGLESASLKQYRNLSHLLEALDRLFVEENIEMPMFQKIIRLCRMASNPTSSPSQLKVELSQLIEQLGYQHPDQSEFKTVTEYIEALSNKKMNSFHYLRV